MSQRKDAYELGTVVVSFLLLAGSTRPFVAAVDRVWVEEGLIYGATAVLGTPFDGNLDVPVLFVCGVLAGWLLLFCLDGTKRIQALFVLVGVGIPFGLFVDETGRIAEAVARTPWAVVVGTVVGLVSGAASSSRFYGTKRPLELSTLEKLRWLQFPAAGGAFFYGMVAVVFVGVVDYAMVADGLVDRLAVATSGVVLVAGLSVFMRYDRRHTTVVVSPPDVEGTEKYQPYLVGGLYETVTNEHHGFPIEGDGELVAAQTARRMADLDARFGSPVTFGFVTSMFRGLRSIPQWIRENWFLRTVIIESNGLTTNQIGDIETNTGGLPAPVETGVARVRHHVRLAVPRVLRRSLGGPYGSSLERLESADTVVLVGPTPADGEEPPAGTDTLLALCERYADRIGTDVVVATTRAGPVAEAEGLAVDSQVLKQTIAVHRLGMDTETYRNCVVVPVDRFHGDSLDGFDDLLDELSR